MKLGLTIVEIRRENKLTQEDFAKLFHVTRQTVSNWENEKSYPDLQTLVDISEHFNLSLDTMLKGDRIMANQRNNAIQGGKVLKKRILRFVCIAAVISMIWTALLPPSISAVFFLS